MAAKKEKIYHLLLFLMLFKYLRTVTATNIDCNGKPFHCINSTHFMICVDLGAGVSTTFDDYVIQCPTTTVCSESNLFECEYEISTTTDSLIRLGDETNKFETGIQTTSDTSFQKTSATKLFSEYTNLRNESIPSNFLTDTQEPAAAIRVTEILTNSEAYIVNETSSTGDINSNFITTTTEKYALESLSSDTDLNLKHFSELLFEGKIFNYITNETNTTKWNVMSEGFNRNETLNDKTMDIKVNDSITELTNNGLFKPDTQNISLSDNIEFTESTMPTILDLFTLPIIKLKKPVTEAVEISSNYNFIGTNVLQDITDVEKSEIVTTTPTLTTLKQIIQERNTQSFNSNNTVKVKNSTLISKFILGENLEETITEKITGNMSSSIDPNKQLVTFSDSNSTMNVKTIDLLINTQFSQPIQTTKNETVFTLNKNVTFNDNSTDTIYKYEFVTEPTSKDLFDIENQGITYVENDNFAFSQMSTIIDDTNSAKIEHPLNATAANTVPSTYDIISTRVLPQELATINTTQKPVKLDENKAYHSYQKPSESTYFDNVTEIENSTMTFEFLMGKELEDIATERPIGTSDLYISDQNTNNYMYTISNLLSTVFPVHSLPTLVSEIKSTEDITVITKVTERTTLNKINNDILTELDGPIKTELDQQSITLIDPLTSKDTVKVKPQTNKKKSVNEIVTKSSGTLGILNVNYPLNEEATTEAIMPLYKRVINNTQDFVTINKTEKLQILEENLYLDTSENLTATGTHYGYQITTDPFNSVNTIIGENSLTSAQFVLQEKLQKVGAGKSVEKNMLSSIDQNLLELNVSFGNPVNVSTEIFFKNTSFAMPSLTILDPGVESTEKVIVTTSKTESTPYNKIKNIGTDSTKETLVTEFDQPSIIPTDDHIYTPKEIINIKLHSTTIAVESLINSSSILTTNQYFSEPITTLPFLSKLTGSKLPNILNEENVTISVIKEIVRKENISEYKSKNTTLYDMVTEQISSKLDTEEVTYFDATQRNFTTSPMSTSFNLSAFPTIGYTLKKLIKFQATETMNILKSYDIFNTTLPQDIKATEVLPQLEVKYLRTTPILTLLGNLTDKSSFITEGVMSRTFTPKFVNQKNTQLNVMERLPVNNVLSLVDQNVPDMTLTEGTSTANTNTFHSLINTPFSKLLSTQSTVESGAGLSLYKSTMINNYKNEALTSVNANSTTVSSQSIKNIPNSKDTMNVTSESTSLYDDTMDVNTKVSSVAVERSFPGSYGNLNTKLSFLKKINKTSERFKSKSAMKIIRPNDAPLKKDVESVQKSTRTVITNKLLHVHYETTTEVNPDSNSATVTNPIVTESMSLTSNKVNDTILIQNLVTERNMKISSFSTIFTENTGNAEKDLNNIENKTATAFVETNYPSKYLESGSTLPIISNDKSIVKNMSFSLEKSHVPDIVTQGNEKKFSKKLPFSTIPTWIGVSIIPESSVSEWSLKTQSDPVNTSQDANLSQNTIIEAVTETFSKSITSTDKIGFNRLLSSKYAVTRGPYNGLLHKMQTSTSRAVKLINSNLKEGFDLLGGVPKSCIKMGNVVTKEVKINGTYNKTVTPSTINLFIGKDIKRKSVSKEFNSSSTESVYLHNLFSNNLNNSSKNEYLQDGTFNNEEKSKLTVYEIPKAATTILEINSATEMVSNATKNIINNRWNTTNDFELFNSSVVKNSMSPSLLNINPSKEAIKSAYQSAIDEPVVDNPMALQNFIISKATNETIYIKMDSSKNNVHRTSPEDNNENMKKISDKNSSKNSESNLFGHVLNRFKITNILSTLPTTDSEIILLNNDTNIMHSQNRNVMVVNTGTTSYYIRKSKIASASDYVNKTKMNKVVFPEVTNTTPKLSVFTSNFIISSDVTPSNREFVLRVTEKMNNNKQNVDVTSFHLPLRNITARHVVYKNKNVFGITKSSMPVFSVRNKNVKQKNANNDLDYKMPSKNVSINDDQSSANEALFTCKNRVRGKYGNTLNCRKFYICLGKIQPLLGECPFGTVFSETKKQCTKNLSHCLRNNQFYCIQEGRFCDLFKNNVYYICVKNNNVFVRFQLQCQDGYLLNKTSMRCNIDEKPQPQMSVTYIDSVSSRSSDQITRTVDQKSKEQKKTETFFCKDEGKFPDPYNCRKYYVCSKNSNTGFRRRVKKCDSDEVFHPKKAKCVDIDSYECK